MSETQKPQEERVVMQHLDNLNDRVVVLKESLDLLEAKLEPALKPQEKKENNGSADKPQEAAYIERMQEITAMVFILQDRVQEITRRLVT